MKFDSSNWNQRYRETPNPYSNKPNEFIKTFFSQSKAQKPSHILVPGDGDGRNGLWLARQGHTVEAFDYSQVAVEQALAKAHQQKLNYKSFVQDISLWQEPIQKYDYIVLVFFHLEPELFQKTLIKYSRALKKQNAFLVAQFFHKNQLGKNSGGPKNKDMLCDSDTFQCIKNDFKFFDAEVLDQNLDEGPLHQGPASLINIVASR